MRGSDELGIGPSGRRGQNAEVGDGDPGSAERPPSGTPDPFRGLHRLIVVTPTRTSESYLDRIYERAGRSKPEELSGFEDAVDAWCDEYTAAFHDAALLEVDLTTAVYWFDQTHERVIAAYGISVSPAGPRDVNRMRSFPDVSVGVKKKLGAAAFAVDRGHFLSHASGGDLDINLFPHRRELNRGWSEEGKLFRKMEREAAELPGTFHFHRAVYDDDTWIPSTLEYGVLRSSGKWWVAPFVNKTAPDVNAAASDNSQVIPRRPTADT